MTDYLPWMVLAGSLFASGQMLGMKLASELRSSAMIRVKIVTAIVGVSLNLFGAHLAGLTGVVVSASIFSAIHFLWMAWIAYQ